MSTKEPPCLAIEGTQERTQEEIDIKSNEEAKWFQEDQLVLSIVQSSLENSLLEAYSYCETACEVWKTLQKVYGNTSNLHRIYEVKQALYEKQQQDMDFTKHFGNYRALWAELEMLRPRTVDPIILNERIEQDKVFGLFMTLPSSYTDLIMHMLREDKLPSLEDVCAKVQKEQGSQNLFKGKEDLAIAHKGLYKSEEKKQVM